MPRPFAALAAIFILAACSTESAVIGSPPAVADGARRFVGVRYGELPPGIESVTGAMIMDGGALTEHALEHVTEGSRQMVWLQRMTGRDEAGRAHWEVVDAVSAPDKSDDLVVGVGECTRAGKPVAGLVGVARFDDEGKETVLRAWIADRAAGRLREVPTAGISCAMEAPCHDEEEES